MAQTLPVPVYKLILYIDSTPNLSKRKQSYCDNLDKLWNRGQFVKQYAYVGFLTIVNHAAVEYQNRYCKKKPVFSDLSKAWAADELVKSYLTDKRLAA